MYYDSGCFPPSCIHQCQGLLRSVVLLGAPTHQMVTVCRVEKDFIWPMIGVMLALELLRRERRYRVANTATISLLTAVTSVEKDR